LSSRWAELPTSCLLAECAVVKELDMHVCTVEDARGVGLSVGEDEGNGAPFDFDVVGRSYADEDDGGGLAGPISGFAGWFTVDFKSRTDDAGKDVAPQIPNPAYLSTGPEMGCEFCCTATIICCLVCICALLHLILLTQRCLTILHSCSQHRYSLGPTSVPSPIGYTTPRRPDHSYPGNSGDDAYER